MISALAIAVLLTSASAVNARPAASVHECRRACAGLIERCVTAGTKRRACRSHILRLCHRLGTDACAAAPPTTAVFPSTTTTTVDPGPTVHGCNRTGAEDHRNQALVVVRFTAFDYAPECIRVSPATTVRFSGDFRTFPLIGGEVGVTDPVSPFLPPTRTGNTKDFVLTEPGLYPYASDPVWVLLGRMWGAVIVE